MAIYFTADTHLGHANIIRHCNRPFATAEEMDTNLISRINDRVKPNDWLYHLGDFSFRGGNPAEYRTRIHCRNMIMILGNHDPIHANGTAKPDFAALFREVHSLLRITVQLNGAARRIVLCHYAMRIWDRCHHGAWHLFGHSHGGLADDPNSLSWDVGVDANGYAPLSVSEIAAIMSRKSFVPRDHHRPRPSPD
jgi:calcineurin-like phosphoesterase family protein